jgi:membrane-bound lytic murein transglycosylase D
MKTKLIVLFAFLTFLTTNLFAQYPSGARNTQPDTSGEAKIITVLNDSGRYFRQGLLNLQDSRRPQAREDFDKSIEVFLLSNIDVRKNSRLNTCYNQLIETVYLMEFPNTSKPPQIRSLSANCSWTIENELADNVAKMSVPAQNTQPMGSDNSLVSSIIETNKQLDSQNGFSKQEYEAPIGEELAKIEFTEAEKVDESNPQVIQQIQQEVEYVQVAVNRGSFGFSFKYNNLVQQYINYYQGRGRVTMETGLYRSGFFTRMARKIFREEGVPENIVWLGQVESAWKPTARSWAAAAGLWQFIPGTGARYGLKINGYVDERSSFEKATRASARYLKFLANRYNGNWEMAMGAYNCGEGNVDRAISRAGGVYDFWTIYPYLPKETRNYVPSILSVILIANNPTKYGFAHVRPAQPLQYDEIRVPAMTNLNLVAQASETTSDYLRYLNPELRQNVSPPEPYIIRIPAGKAQKAFAVLKKIPLGSVNNAAIANVSNGETMQNISNRTGVPVQQIQVANAGNPVQGKVVVPSGNNIQRTSYSRPTTPTASPKASVRTVKAQNGDTATKIAARYGVSAVELAKFNGLAGVDQALAAGREIKLP